jgi:hypothetical protein
MLSHPGYMAYGKSWMILPSDSMFNHDFKDD